MQVDQFESEVESLSVQTRKKKGDKEVSSSPASLLYLPCVVCISQPEERLKSREPPPPPFSTSSPAEARSHRRAEEADREAQVPHPHAGDHFTNAGQRLHTSGLDTEDQRRR